MKRTFVLATAALLGVASIARAQAQEVVPAPEPAAEMVPPPPVVAAAPPPPPPPPKPAAAIPAEAPTSLRPIVDVIGQYGIRNYTGGGARPGWFHQFELGRAFLGAEGRYRGAVGRVVLEATRSANDGGLIGVAGNALVMNVREAYAGYRYAPFDARYGALEGRLGIVPTLFVPVIERAWQLRAIDRTTPERTGYLPPADVGAQLRYELPKKFGAVSAAFENGEGYQRPELNRGKSTSIGLELHPLATVHRHLEPLALLAGYQDNATGTDNARADRALLGVLYTTARYSGGATLVYALGADGDAQKHGYAGEAFAALEPWGPLILGARISYWRRDTRVAGDQTTQITGTVGVRIVKPLEVYLAATRNWLGSGALGALPGEDYFEGRVIARVRFGP